MCGIAGFVGSRQPIARDTAVLRAMCDAIAHRGPDDSGYFVDAGVALGMRRLSIIDVQGGHQPIANEDGSVQLVFNGEIYNYRSLYDRLRGRHDLRTSSDTETIVHLYEEDGDRLVHALRGMFAFAVWDTRRSRLLVARDRLGIKPLYYQVLPTGVAFASELRALLALPQFRPELDHDAIIEYFTFGYVPDPATIFQGVNKLPPGHLLTWSAEEGVRVSRYWSCAVPERRVNDERDVIEELRGLLDECVSSHLMSEVPLGAFLSGGIDSSAVVSTMRRVSPTTVRSFSIGFDEESFDESKHAARIAAAIGTQHTELIARPDVDALVNDVIRAFDEPFADSSAIPTFLVSQLARQYVTVALSGDGGDELFGGYTRYAETMRRRGVSGEWLRRMVQRIAIRLPHSAPGRKYLRDLARSPRGRYASTVAASVGAREHSVLRPELAERAGDLDTLLDRWFTVATDRDFASQMMLVDLQSYLPGDILTKVDRASMASSLEARVLLLDHVLVEFAASLPATLKLRGGQGKWILRRAIEERVPPAVLAHPKRGFGVPLVQWLRHELSHRLDALLMPNAPVQEFADPTAVRRLIREHRLHRRNHMGMLWRLVVLNVWLEHLRTGALVRPASSEAVREFVAAGQQ